MKFLKTKIFVLLCIVLSALLVSSCAIKQTSRLVYSTNLGQADPSIDSSKVVSNWNVSATDSSVTATLVYEDGFDSTSESPLYKLYILGNGEMKGYSICAMSNNSFDTVYYPWHIDGYADSIKSVYVGDYITTLNKSCFSNLQSLESVTLGLNITLIPSNAFENCTSLKNVDLPSRTTTIANNAFANCNLLESIYIPVSLLSYGKNAFEQCDSLKNIYFQGTQTEWEKIVSSSSSLSTVDNVETDCLLKAKVTYDYKK